MPDARNRLRLLDRIEPPDVWQDATTRTPSREPDDDVIPAPSASRRIVAASVAFCVFGAAAFFLARAFDGGPRAGDPPSTAATPGEMRGAWQALPESPLSPRYGAQAYWVAGRIVIMGGRDSEPCPPGADCALPEEPSLRDGAAFVPETDAWTRIADAPFPISGASGSVLDETVYLWISALEQRPEGRPVFLAYHASEDRWEQLPSPPGAGPTSSLQLAATDDAIVAYPTSHEYAFSPDLLFEPSTAEWQELPPDPLVPSYDRTMVWTGDELLLLALGHAPAAESRAPSFYRAAALDIAAETWRQLPDSEVLGYDPMWFWSAGQVVNPTIGESNGGGSGGGDYGRFYPYGGMLDPMTSTWSDLPAPPSELGGYHGPVVGGGDHVVSFQGAILDVAAGMWSVLPAPPGVGQDIGDEGVAAVWAGDRLVVWGGVVWRSSEEPSLLDTGWSWLPASK